MTAPVKAGDMRLNEPDYFVRHRNLLLEVSKVGSVQQQRDGHWLDLERFTLRVDGTQVSTEPRQVLVWVNALRTAVQWPKGNP